jgi:hypothetical protein
MRDEIINYFSSATLEPIFTLQMATIRDYFSLGGDGTRKAKFFSIITLPVFSSPSREKNLNLAHSKCEAGSQSLSFRALSGDGK